MKATLTVRIPDGLKEELEEISAAERTAVSDLVRESIERYLAVRKFRKLRKRVLPFAEAQGLLLDEDVFKLIS